MINTSPNIGGRDNFCSAPQQTCAILFVYRHEAGRGRVLLFFLQKAEAGLRGMRQPGGKQQGKAPGTQIQVQVVQGGATDGVRRGDVRDAAAAAQRKAAAWCGEATGCTASPAQSLLGDARLLVLLSGPHYSAWGTMQEA